MGRADGVSGAICIQMEGTTEDGAGAWKLAEAQKPKSGGAVKVARRT
jgi:hypothetical protein